VAGWTSWSLFQSSHGRHSRHRGSSEALLFMSFCLKGVALRRRRRRRRGRQSSDDNTSVCSFVWQHLARRLVGFDFFGMALSISTRQRSRVYRPWHNR
jgi:hypothetical protein